jgi:hypothetical protein
MRFWFPLFLLLPAAVQAAAPVAIIKGPTGGRPGDLIVLDARESKNAEHYEWQITADNGHETIAQFAMEAVIPTHPGTYYVFLAVSNNEGLDFAKWKVTITSPNPPTPPPNPPSPPNPPTPPTPPTPPGPTPPPDGKFGIAPLVYAEALKLNRPLEAAAYAGVFESVAKDIRDEKLIGPLAVLTAMKERSKKAVPDRTAWQGVNGVVESKLKSLYDADRLGSDADWADCCAEIALGLRATIK